MSGYSVCVIIINNKKPARASDCVEADNDTLYLCGICSKCRI